MCVEATPSEGLKKKVGGRGEEVVMKVRNCIQCDVDEGEKERKKEWGEEDEREPPR